MGLIDKKPFDMEQPLANAKHELFCIELVRLTVDNEIRNKKARRISAYRSSFPENDNTSDSILDGRAKTILKRPDVSERIEYLFSLEDTGVENHMNWTRSKAEDYLLEIINDEDAKAGDRIKAITTLNVMRGVSEPSKDEGVKGDPISEFLKKFGGK